MMDGGKWICDPLSLRRKRVGDPSGSRQRNAGGVGSGGGERCLVYSVGSEKDTLFERDMVAQYRLRRIVTPSTPAIDLCRWPSLVGQKQKRLAGPAFKIVFHCFKPLLGVFGGN